MQGGNGGKGKKITCRGNSGRITVTDSLVGCSGGGTSAGMTFAEVLGYANITEEYKTSAANYGSGNEVKTYERPDLSYPYNMNIEDCYVRAVKDRQIVPSYFYH